MLKKLFPFMALIVIYSCSKDLLNDQNALYSKFNQAAVSTDNYQAGKSYHANPIVSDKISNLISQTNNSLAGDHLVFVNRVRDHLSQELNVLEKIEEKYGEMIFEFSKYTKDENSELLIVPSVFELSENIATVVIFYEENDRIKYKPQKRQNLQSLKRKDKLKPNNNGKFKNLSFELAGSIFAYFDFILFDYNDCALIDALDQNRDLVCTGTWYEVTTCYCSEGGGTTYCYDCTVHYEWDGVCEVIDNDGGSTGNDSGGGSSGNNGSGSNQNPSSTPCEGDPVMNPQIARTRSSDPNSTIGGMFGCTRKSVKSNCTDPIYNRSHNGIDIKNAVGDDVFSMYDGEVVEVKGGVAIGQNGNGGLGNRIAVETTTPNGQVFILRYSHLDPNINYQVGNMVKAGDVLGKSGDTGNISSTGFTGEFHVHIEAFLNTISLSTRIDPRPYFHTSFSNNGASSTTPNC